MTAPGYSLQEIRESDLPFSPSDRFIRVPTGGHVVTIGSDMFERFTRYELALRNIYAYSQSDDQRASLDEVVHDEATRAGLVDDEAARRREREVAISVEYLATQQAEQVVVKYLALVRSNGAAAMLAVVSEETAPGERYSQVFEELCVTAEELGYEATENRLGDLLWEAKDDVKETLAREIIAKMEG